MLTRAAIAAQERTTSCGTPPLPPESLPCGIYSPVNKKHNKRMLLGVRKTRNGYRGPLLHLGAARKLKIKGSEIERS